MNSEKMKRKLIAILSADVKGYSRLMSMDEETTVRTLNTYKQVMGDLIRHYGGRVVDAPGDNLLAEFASVVDAVQCAVEIQKELKGRNAGLPEDRRMEFRIGVNLGDVMGEGKKIFGDAVNIVARVEGLAEPGGVCISGTAYDQVKNRLPFGFKPLGEQVVKNIAEPVRVYRVLMEPGIPVSRWAVAKKIHPRQWRRAALSLGVVLIVAAAAVVIWGLYLRPALPPAEVASEEKMAFPLPDKPSIAVLPFINMSKDPDQEYFIDGMTDDLITDLSKISGVFVIARTSTFTYKGKPVKVKQVAEELGVRYVLEGSVRRAGEQVRINAQLIDGTKGHHLWAERYDSSMKDVFALQDRITQKIVLALAVKLTGSEKEMVAQKGTDNVAAYDAFLRGWGHYLRLTPEDYAKAAASFKKAIELDPNYGRAYAALSAVYWDASLMLALLKGLGVSWYEARAQSIQYLQNATEDPITHSVKSQRYLWRRQHQEAISELERGLALDPNDPACHLKMGSALNMAGRPKEAIEFFKRGMRLDPHNPSRYLVGLGGAHFCMGELQEAVALVEKAKRLNPENVTLWACSLATYYGLLGRDQEARAMIETLKKEKFDSPGTINLRWFMNSTPYKDRAIADRFSEGLLKAGVPPPPIPGGYFPAFKENQLTGEEIRSLLFGSRITGYVFYPQQFWVNYKKNGELTWDGPSIMGGPTIDSGKSRIEGDAICWQYQKRFWGVEYCGTVFRYPGGTSEGKDEYFWCTDFGFGTFSLVK